MRVLHLGALGYIGRHTIAALQAAGHDVTAVARSTRDSSDEPVRTVFPDLADVSELTRLARDHEAVMYTAAAAPEIEEPALDALLAALQDSGQPLVVLGGSLVYGDTGPATFDEARPYAPPPFLAGRAAIEQRVLAARELGVRSSVVHGSLVYGHGGGDIPLVLLASAATRGHAAYVGDGANAWSTVHVDDLARLLAAALERAPAGAVYNASHETLTMREVAGAVSAALGLDEAPRSMEVEALTEWRFFAAPLSLDQRFSSDAAIADIGWRPRGAGFAEALTGPEYRAVPRPAAASDRR